MNTRKILNIRKTDHCLERQDERDVPDDLLKLIFEKYDIKISKRLYVIVRYAALNALGYYEKNFFLDKDTKGLVLRFSGKCLTTCYFCADPEYLFRAHPKFDFIIIE